jgi:hypothetical protein
MNKELLKLVKAAHAPKEMLKEEWFKEFCENFASVILAEAEAECEKEYQVVLAQEEVKNYAIN